jgi:hypothetical protein
MKLPYAAQARVQRKKIIEYLLSSSHPDGGAKARFFTRFGFRVEKWKTFARALKQQGRVHDVTGSIESKYGRRYSVDGALESPDRDRNKSRLLKEIGTKSPVTSTSRNYLWFLMAIAKKMGR